MKTDIDLVIDKIRDAKGPFFLARLNLRVKFPPPGKEPPNPTEFIRNLVAASREMGYDPLTSNDL